MSVGGGKLAFEKSVKGKIFIDLFLCGRLVKV
jgi:hypothetical protein